MFYFLFGYTFFQKEYTDHHSISEGFCHVDIAMNFV